MRISGIYKIQSVLFPDRVYIGSAIDVEHRWFSHRSRLIRGVHGNARLQNHVTKYGIDDLTHSFLHLCNDKELIEAEQFFIDSYIPYFNICKIAYSTLGRPSWSKGTKGIKKASNGSFKKGHIPWHSGTKGLKPNVYKGKTNTCSEEILNRMRISNQRAWDIRKGKLDAEYYNATK